jgi:hypothetical protein
MMAAILYLSCDHGLKRVLVDVSGENWERLDVEPLARFLRRQHTWPGHDRIELRVNYPRRSVMRSGRRRQYEGRSSSKGRRRSSGFRLWGQGDQHRDPCAHHRVARHARPAAGPRPADPPQAGRTVHDDAAGDTGGTLLRNHRLGVIRATTRWCSGIGAPGVTRTPGTQFRKLLLYPPELRGRGPDEASGTF